MDRFKRIPVREQEPKVRATNFEEVCLGYNEEEAVAEASRCLNCPKPRCVGGCPVGINIPGFIAKVKERDFKNLLFVPVKTILPALFASYPAHSVTTFAHFLPLPDNNQK